MGLGATITPWCHSIWVMHLLHGQDSQFWAGVTDVTGDEASISSFIFLGKGFYYARCVSYDVLYSLVSRNGTWARGVLVHIPWNPHFDGVHKVSAFLSNLGDTQVPSCALLCTYHTIAALLGWVFCNKSSLLQAEMSNSMLFGICTRPCLPI